MVQSQRTMLIDLFAEQHQTVDSPRIVVQPSKKYKLEVTINGKKGLPHSGYVSIIILDSQNRERNRYIRWITDFSGISKKYIIIFTTNESAKTAVIGYRINIDTPVRSDIELVAPDPSTLKLEETSEAEVYDNIKSFKIPAFLPLSTEDEDLLESNVVWIFGAPRSGTTWLGIRLLKDSETIVWNEPWIGYHLSGILTDESPLRGQQSLERLLDIRSDTDEYFFSNAHKNNWLPALRKLLLARIYSQAQILLRNVIIKEPAGARSADLLLECLPKSKMIFLLRDGRDVVESRLDAEETLGSKSLGEEKLREKRYRAIFHYSNSWNVIINDIMRAYEKHDPALRLLVRYEQLKTDTFTELKKIYQFIGIGISDEDLKRKAEYYDFKNIPDSEKGSGKFNRAATTGAWRNTFSKREIELMNSIMGDTLKKMGYEV